MGHTETSTFSTPGAESPSGSSTLGTYAYPIASNNNTEVVAESTYPAHVKNCVPRLIPKYASHPRRYFRTSSTICCRVRPRIRRVTKKCESRRTFGRLLACEATMDAS